MPAPPPIAHAYSLITHAAAAVVAAPVLQPLLPAQWPVIACESGSAAGRTRLHSTLWLLRLRCEARLVCGGGSPPLVGARHAAHALAHRLLWRPRDLAGGHL